MSEQEQDRDPQYEGWLTAAEVETLTGKSQPSISRLAGQGVLVRERVSGAFLYEPESVERVAGGKTKPPTLSDAASVVQSHAAMLRALSSMVPELVDRVIKMSEVHQVASEKLISQLTSRCSQLESLQTSMLEARESHLDGTAERAMAAEAQRAKLETKAKLVQQLADNGPALLELATAMLKGESDEPKEEPKEEGSADCPQPMKKEEVES